METTTRSLEEFKNVARRFALSLKQTAPAGAVNFALRNSPPVGGSDSPRSKFTAPAGAATIVALSGELGAGKTTFVQEVAKTLGVEETVTSPTFVIEKIYQLKGNPSAGGFERLIHIDAYRLNSAHELEVLGWKEIASDPHNLILIEWPEKVVGLIPDSAIRIRFDIVGEERQISHANGEMSS